MLNSHHLFIDWAYTYTLFTYVCIYEYMFTFDIIDF